MSVFINYGTQDVVPPLADESLPSAQPEESSAPRVKTPSGLLKEAAELEGENLSKQISNLVSGNPISDLSEKFQNSLKETGQRMTRAACSSVTQAEIRNLANETGDAPVTKDYLLDYAEKYPQKRTF